MGQSNLKGQHPALQSKYVFTKNPTVYIINLVTTAIINCAWLSYDGLGLFNTLWSIHSVSHSLLCWLTEHQLQEEVQNFYVPDLNFLILKLCVLCVCVCVSDRSMDEYIYNTAFNKNTLW